MIVAAVHGLAELPPALQYPDKTFLSDIKHVRGTSINIALKII